MIGREEENRPAPVGHEVLPDPREEPVHVHPRVLRAGIFGDVARAEGKQVPALATLLVGDAKALTRPDAHGDPFPSWHHDSLGHPRLLPPHTSLGTHAAW